MVFNNSECSFDDHNVQGQYNFTQSFQGEIVGYTTVSTYKNQIGMDSVINQIWFDALFLYDNDHNPIPKDQIKDVLKNRKRDLIMQVQIEDEINKRFHNKRFPHNPSVASYDVIDDFNVEILDFKVPYNAKCIDEELIYLKLQLEGNLYAFDHFTLIDTIYIQETEVSLLFSIN